MGSSSSSCSSPDPSHEQFTFRFTDCSCQCDAKKKYPTDSELPPTTFLTAFMSKINRAQYDLHCDCDCGEGVKMGFLFGNTSSAKTEF